MTHRRNTAGFTLVELLIAATVTVLIAGSATMVLRGVTEADRRIESRAQLGTEGRAGVSAIADAIRNAYRPTAENERRTLEGIDDSIDGVPRDRVRFFTVGHTPIRAGQPESDVREVEFGLMDPGDGSLPTLVRRLDPTRNDGEDGGGVVERIASDVMSLDVTYHDGVEFRDDWPEELGFPTAVKFELAIAPTHEGAEPLVMTRTVALAHGYRATAETMESPQAEDAQGAGTAPTQRPRGAR